MKLFEFPIIIIIIIVVVIIDCEAISTIPKFIPLTL